MPTRVTSGSNTAITDKTAARGLEFYSTHPMSLNLSRIEDAELAGTDDPSFKGYLHECMKDFELTSTGAAASQSARFPKSTSSGEIASSPLKSTKNVIELRANYSARRKPSVKEPKASSIQVLSRSSPSKR